MSIQAKRKSKCGRCGEMIEPGDLVSSWEDPRDGHRDWAHATCKGKNRLEPDEEGEDDFFIPGMKGARGGGGNGSTEIPQLVVEKARQELEGFVNEKVEDLVHRNGKAIEACDQRLRIKVHEELIATGARIEKGLRELAESAREQRIVIETKPGSTPSQEELPKDVYHEAFPEVLKLAGMGLDTLLWGPAGCGKTHMVYQVSVVLPNSTGQDHGRGTGKGRPFGFVNGSEGITERHFTGTSLPNLHTGKDCFVSTPFVRCFEEGGVFLVDEGDAMDPNVWVCLNSAMSNGILSLPMRSENPVARRHADFVLIVGANTVGTGADQAYTARVKLDLSTLDRFAGCMIPVDYSPTIERALCPEERLLKLLWGWRDNIAKAGISRILSTRFVARAYRFYKSGENALQIANRLTQMAGWTEDEASAVVGANLAKRLYHALEPHPEPGKIKDGLIIKKGRPPEPEGDEVPF